MLVGLLRPYAVLVNLSPPQRSSVAPAGFVIMII